MNKLRIVRSIKLGNGYEIHSHKEVVDNNNDIIALSGHLEIIDTDLDSAESNIIALSGVVDANKSWDRNGTILTPRNIDDSVEVKEMTIGDLSGAVNTVPVTDANGTLVDTGVTITDAPLNGSMISIQPYPSDPVLKITHDVFLEDVDAITKRLVYFDGFDRYSVTLDKEV